MSEDSSRALLGIGMPKCQCRAGRQEPSPASRTGAKGAPAFRAWQLLVRLILAALAARPTTRVGPIVTEL